MHLEWVSQLLRRRDRPRFDHGCVCAVPSKSGWFSLRLPITALFGWFGPSLETAAAEHEPSIRSGVSEPPWRFHLIERVSVRVTNFGDASLERVRISFDESYIQRFSEISFTPVAARAHAVGLPELKPSETRTVAVELKADQYGPTRGLVKAASEEAHVAVPVHTFILP